MCCPITLGLESNSTMPTTKKRKKTQAWVPHALLLMGLLFPLRLFNF